MKGTADQETPWYSLKNTLTGDGILQYLIEVHFFARC